MKPAPAAMARAVIGFSRTRTRVSAITWSCRSFICDAFSDITVFACAAFSDITLAACVAAVDILSTATWALLDSLSTVGRNAWAVLSMVSCAVELAWSTVSLAASFIWFMEPVVEPDVVVPLPPLPDMPEVLVPDMPAPEVPVLAPEVPVPEVPALVPDVPVPEVPVEPGVDDVLVVVPEVGKAPPVVDTEAGLLPPAEPGVELVLPGVFLLVSTMMVSFIKSKIKHPADGCMVQGKPIVPTMNFRASHDKWPCHML